MTAIYIYEYIDGLTDRCHSGGGLMIVTSGKPQSVWNRYLAKQDEPNNLDETLPEPTKRYTLSAEANEELIIFPDAGCC